MFVWYVVGGFLAGYCFGAHSWRSRSRDGGYFTGQLSRFLLGETVIGRIGARVYDSGGHTTSTVRSINYLFVKGSARTLPTGVVAWQLGSFDRPGSEFWMANDDLAPAVSPPTLDTLLPVFPWLNN